MDHQLGCETKRLCFGEAQEEGRRGRQTNSGEATTQVFGCFSRRLWRCTLRMRQEQRWIPSTVQRHTRLAGAPRIIIVWIAHEHQKCA
jgi:hypothetical protein